MDETTRRTGKGAEEILGAISGHQYLQDLTDGDITREALRILKNANGTIRKVNRQYDDRFATTGAKNGGNLLIRLPNRYSVTTGRTATTGGDNTVETSTTLTVATQKHVSMGFFSSELTLSLDDFSSRYLKPAMSVLASTIASDLCVGMQSAFVNYVGTPGTTPVRSSPIPKLVSVWTGKPLPGMGTGRSF